MHRVFHHGPQGPERSHGHPGKGYRWRSIFESQFARAPLQSDLTLPGLQCDDCRPLRRSLQTRATRTFGSPCRCGGEKNGSRPCPPPLPPHPRFQAHLPTVRGQQFTTRAGGGGGFSEEVGEQCRLDLSCSHPLRTFCPSCSTYPSLCCGASVQTNYLTGKWCTSFDSECS